MALRGFNWLLAIALLSTLAAMAFTGQVAHGQYTFVQDSDSVGDWIDPLNWDTDNNPGTPNTTFPNGVGVTAVINQPIWSSVAGGYTLDMPATDVTVGTLTIDNTNDFYAHKITMANHGGRLVFEDPSGTAKWIETTNGTPGDAPPSIQNSIQMPILVKNTLEITQNNYPNLNTGTIFTNRFDGDINSKIIKKGAGGIQFNLNSEPAADRGFFGQIEIQEGAIRLINETFSIAKVSGMTVSSGAQLQLADTSGAGGVVPDYNLAAGAVLNLNGNGRNNSGALQFGIMGGRTTTFHNSVNLESDSRIHVSTASSVGVINQPVTGGGDLIKTGAGKLTLTAANTYTGDTRLNNGILSMTNATLHDAADVYLVTGTTFDLDFDATDTIRSLYVDGVIQPAGTYGASALGASFFTGTGLLNVTSPVDGVPGDYNDDGFVDAADYVVWRKGGPLANEVDNPGVVNEQDYTEWRARFGNPPDAGSLFRAAAVPEPSTLMLLVFIAPILASGKLRGKRS